MSTSHRCRATRVGALILVTLVVLGSCESTGSSNGGRTAGAREPAARGNTGTGKGFWDQLEENRGAHVADAERRAQLARGARELPPGWKQKIQDWWRIWTLRPKDVDPSLARWPDPDKLHKARVDLRKSWVSARSEWVDLGPGAVNILVENLLSWYVRAYDANAGYEVDRAKTELGLFKKETVPYVVECLSGVRGDDVVRTRLGELLASFGDVGVPAIEDAWGSADDAGRKALVKALKQMRAPSSAPLLQRVAGDRDVAWQTRIEAIDALGKMAAKSAAPTFRRCLSDDDRSVRKFAARHMHAVSSGSQTDKLALVTAMEEALRRKEIDVAQACNFSLAKLTGRRIRLDPVRWRAAITSGGGN